MKKLSFYITGQVFLLLFILLIGLQAVSISKYWIIALAAAVTVLTYHITNLLVQAGNFRDENIRQSLKNCQDQLSGSLKMLGDTTVSINQALEGFISASKIRTDEIRNIAKEFHENMNSLLTAHNEKVIALSMNANKESQEIIALQGKVVSELITGSIHQQETLLEDILEGMEESITKIIQKSSQNNEKTIQAVAENTEKLRNEMELLSSEYKCFMDYYNQIHEQTEAYIEQITRMNEEDVKLMEKMINDK